MERYSAAEERTDLLEKRESQRKGEDLNLPSGDSSRYNTSRTGFWREVRGKRGVRRTKGSIPSREEKSRVEIKEKKKLIIE